MSAKRERTKKKWSGTITSQKCCNFWQYKCQNGEKRRKRREKRQQKKVGGGGGGGGANVEVGVLCKVFIGIEM